MRHSRDMTHAQLVALVERLRAILYVRTIERGDVRCPEPLRVAGSSAQAGEWTRVWDPAASEWQDPVERLGLLRDAMNRANLAPAVVAEVRSEHLMDPTTVPHKQLAEEVPWQDVSTHMLDEGSGKILFGAETAEAVLALEALFPNGRWIETDEQQRLLDPGLRELDLVRREPPTWVVWGEGPPSSDQLARAPRPPEAVAVAAEQGFDVASNPARWAVMVSCDKASARAWKNCDHSVRGWHQMPERELGMASLALQPSSGLAR